MPRPSPDGFLLLTTVISLGAGAVCFLAGQASRGHPRRLTFEEIPAAGAVQTGGSFSEIEDSRARLAELASIALTESRIRHLHGARARAADPTRPDPTRSRIAELERLCVEFRGTGHEALFVRELLLVHRVTGRDHDWLDVYLGFLYRTPTHPLVSQFAREALDRAAGLGREPEIRRALNHVLAIPMPLEGHPLLQALLRPEYPSRPESEPSPVKPTA